MTRRPRPAHTGATEAVIDIGTNSVKLLVGYVRTGRVHTVHWARATTRLGSGVGRSRRISDQAVERTVRVVRGFAAVARRMRAVRIEAVGTLAMRAATNGRSVARRIAREAGVPVRVLSGRDEAMLSFLSASARLARPARYVLVIDVGGGSTELIAADRGRVVLARSLPLGALRLTERFLSSDPIAQDEYRALTREVDAVIGRGTAALGKLPPRMVSLVACGGSSTTALDMAQRGRPRGYRRLHSLTLADARALERMCLRLALDERKRLPGLPPDRADIIPAGIAVVIAFMTRTRKRSIWISDGGVREGVMLAHAR